MRCDVDDDLAHEAAEERARVGDEGGDHELVGAGCHGAANLVGAVVGRSRDGEAIEQEVAEPEAIDEASPRSRIARRTLLP